MLNISLTANPQALPAPQQTKQWTMSTEDTKNYSFQKNLLKETIVSYETCSQVYVDIDLPLPLLLFLSTTKKSVPRLTNRLSKKIVRNVIMLFYFYIIHLSSHYLILFLYTFLYSLS